MSENLRRLGKILKHAGPILSVVRDAREGSWISRGLALASVAGTMIDRFVPEPSLTGQLQARGFVRVITPLGAFAKTALRDLPTVTLQVEPERAVVFADAVAILESGEVYARTVERFRSLLQAAVWRGFDMSVTVDDSGDIALRPMKPPGAYIGEPSVDYIVERLQRRGSGARSILLVGSTGSGKSTLGRLVARSVVDGHTLKVPATVLGHQGSDKLLGLVRDLAPAVLLIDDIQELVDIHHGASQVLGALEELHGHRTILVGTMMTESPHEEHGRHYAGFRPGRFDETILLPRPTAETRRRILNHYGPGVDWPEPVIRATNGLTGAYLAELAARVELHGLDGWKAEVSNLKRFSPSAPRRHNREGSMLYTLTRRVYALENQMKTQADAKPADAETAG